LYKLLLLISAVALAACGLAPVQATPAPSAPSKQPVTKTLLALVDAEEMLAETLTVSPDRQHAAYVVQPEGSPAYVVYDGQRQGPYTRVGFEEGGAPLLFSPDGQHLAYMAVSSNGYVIVLDGEEQGPYEQVIVDSVVFSPDSQRLAYGAVDRSGNAFAVVDGQRGPAYDQVDRPRFSPDSQRVGYSARRGGQWFMVVDGQAGRAYEDVYAWAPFSPDSQHVAYRASLGDGTFVVRDETPDPAFDAVDVGSLTFSPDSQRLAYVAVQDNQSVAMLDGQEYGRYEMVYGASLFFSADSRRLLYVASEDDFWYTVVEGMEFGPYVYLDLPVFSDDGQHYAFLAVAGSQMQIIVDGETRVTQDWTAGGWLRFLPDSQTLTYVQVAQDQWMLVVGDQAYGPFEALNQPVYSPDGGRVALAAEVDEKVFLVVDGEPSAPYAAMGQPVFSPTGAHLAVTVTENGLTYMLVDGRRGEGFDLIWGAETGAAHFDSAHSLRYVARLGDQLVMVEHRLPTRMHRPNPPAD